MKTMKKALSAHLICLALAAVSLGFFDSPVWAQSGGGMGSSTAGGGFGGSSGGGGSFSGGTASGGALGLSGGTFGSSSSGSFGGGFSGGGSGSGFSGGTGFGTTSSGSYRSGGGIGGSSTNIYLTPSASNVFSTYYANPLAAGTSSATGRNTFGMPLYTLTTTTGTTGNLNSGSASGLNGMNYQGTTGTGNSTSTGWASPYVTTTASSQLLLGGGKLYGDVSQVLERSSSLPSREMIQVTVQGETVILEGRVTDDHERRLAEALVRLTPGVHEVRNDLTIGVGGPTPP